MVKRSLRANVKPMSVRVLLWGLAVILLINVLARFNVLDLTSSTANILTLIGAFFLLMEVSAFSMLRRIGRGKTNVLDIVIALVALLAIVGSGLSLVGMSTAFLMPIQGLVDGGLLIFVLVEIFRKNK